MDHSFTLLRIKKTTNIDEWLRISRKVNVITMSKNTIGSWPTTFPDRDLVVLAGRLGDQSHFVVLASLIPCNFEFEFIL